MLLRGLIVEAVNVRSSEETFNLEPHALRPLDLWTPSALETYRLVTANATSAALNFYNPQNPELMLRNFLVGTSVKKISFHGQEIFIT